MFRRTVSLKGRDEVHCLYQKLGMHESSLDVGQYVMETAQAAGGCRERRSGA